MKIKTPIYALLEQARSKYPYLRIGQLISNLCLGNEQVFYLSDDELSKRLVIIAKYGFEALKKIDKGSPTPYDKFDEEDLQIYPCIMCGKARSKAEGGTTFTVCEDCWDKK